MNKPIVSIVIPTFNRADITVHTLDSLLAQQFNNWEAIIVDDGSSDHTHQLLEHYSRKDKRISWYARPAEIPKGANGCRNYGFAKSSGAYIKWVDSDDILPPDALDKQVSVLSQDPAVVVCLGQGVFFNHETNALEEPWSRNVESNNLPWAYIRNQVRWPIGGPLWRRDFFSSPPFDVHLKNSQEWLMHGQQILRLSRHQIRIIPDIVYLIRRGNERMSTGRNAIYFKNQAKARALLLRSSMRASSGLKFKAELVKQILIYYYHFVRRKILAE